MRVRCFHATRLGMRCVLAVCTSTSSRKVGLRPPFNGDPRRQFFVVFTRPWNSTIHPTPPPPLYLDFLFSCIHLCRSENLACLSNVRPSQKVRWAEDGETGHSSSAAMRRVPLCVARKDVYRISGPEPSPRLPDLPPPPCNRTTCTRSRPATCRSLHPCISHDIEGYDRPSG